jgi:L-threonylcarbamoyladenylate synthase
VRRIRIEELLSAPEETAWLADTLRRGGLAAIPTETFYGLAADPQSETGVGRILAMKRRDAAKPLLVLFGAARQLAGLGVAAPAATLDRYFSIWPAALTVVLPLAAPIPASRDAFSLGVRMPAHPSLRELLARVGPVTGTSLNRSGEPPCEEADEAARQFPGEIDVLVDGGRTAGGLPSTLLDATVEPPLLLRAGAYPWPASRP